jgi:uncharacterized Fe-S cluster protein YjdI/CDGSH-type Zn-finger protein
MAATEEADAGQGGTGAPPPTNQSNNVRAGLTREYARPEIVVEWYASRCIHSGACIRALPAVFNPGRRPWVNVSDADPDAIAQAVTRCPTGALRFQRLDGGEQESAGDRVSITPIANGPYFVRGPIEMVNPQTGEPQRETRVALCRCGKSGHMPFCDNTHRAIGFRSDVTKS